MKKLLGLLSLISLSFTRVAGAQGTSEMPAPKVVTPGVGAEVVHTKPTPEVNEAMGEDRRDEDSEWESHHNREHEAFRDRWNANSRLLIGFGYAYSRWHSLSPDLDNGSTVFDIGFSHEHKHNFESQLNFQFLNGSDSSGNNENIYNYGINFGGRWYFNSSGIRPFAGLALAFGWQRAWGMQSDSATSVTYNKYSSGVYGGVIPALGVRFPLCKFIALDLSAFYDAYFPGDAFHEGGPGIMATFALAHR